MLRLLENRLTTWTQPLDEAIRLPAGELRYRRCEVALHLSESSVYQDLDAYFNAFKSTLKLLKEPARIRMGSDA